MTRLSRIRHQLRLTQTAAAHLLGITQQTYQRRERRGISDTRMAARYAADSIAQAVQTFLKDAPLLKKFARALDELHSDPIAKKYRYSNKLLVREP